MIIQMLPSYDFKCAALGAKMIGIEVNHSNTVGGIAQCHVGSLGFVTTLLEKHNVALVTPDYYPEFLYAYRRRSISPVCFSGSTTLQRVFAKPSDKYKGSNHETTGRIFEMYEYVPKNYIISGVVSFWKEARYYVAGGDILAKYEYPATEDGINTEYWPEVEFPENFCGAVDFGYLENGDFCLVESHHPYSCGWYGPESEADIYALWLQLGWEWMVSGGSS